MARQVPNAVTESDLISLLAGRKVAKTSPLHGWSKEGLLKALGGINLKSIIATYEDIRLHGAKDSDRLAAADRLRELLLLQSLSDPTTQTLLGARTSVRTKSDPFNNLKLTGSD